MVRSTYSEQAIRVHLIKLHDHQKHFNRNVKEYPTSHKCQTSDYNAINPLLQCCWLMILTLFYSSSSVVLLI